MPSDQRYVDPFDWVRTWQAAGPRLETLRRADLRVVDVPAFVASMVDAYEAARLQTPTSTATGLITQQLLLRKLRA